MASATLTDVKLRGLKPAAGKRIEVWDAQLPGFGLRVSSSGTKSFILLYRIHGKSRRLTLGRYPVLSLADARIRARDALNAVASGVDPREADRPITNAAGKVVQAKAQTSAKHRLDHVVKQFVERHCKRNNRANTALETERVLKANLVSQWPTRDVRDIAKADILGLLDAIVDAGKPSAANHAFAAIRKFFNWCVERGLLETSPCLGIKMPAKAASRSRVLDDDELAKVWQASGQTGYPFGTIVQLLILTGQRRSEVGSMRWSAIDFDERTWAIPPEDNKSGRLHVVPLTDATIELIEACPRTSETFVFPSLRSPERCFSGYSKCKARLDAASGVTDWTLHDLRRTMATGLASLGAPPHVVEKLLNHTSGTFSGVAGIYNRFEYRPEMRAALETWAVRMQGLS